MSRYSLNSERQELHADTQDFYDDTGIPPPHRLSGFSSPYGPVNSSRTSLDAPGGRTDSTAHLAYNLYPTPSYQRFSRPSLDDVSEPYTDAAGSPRRPYSSASGAAGMTLAAAPAGGAAAMYASRGGPYSTTADSYQLRDHRGSYGAKTVDTVDTEHDAWLVGGGGMDDADIALARSGGTNASFANLSPAVAARERYIARKEANGGEKGGGAGGIYGAYGDMDRPSGSRKKWYIIGGVVGVVAILAIVIGAVVASQKSKKSGAGGSVSGVTQSDPKDPSKFVKDAALKKSFYGMAYAPIGSVPPDCGATLDAVIEDVQLLSQLTTRVRTYGASCSTADFVLDAVKQTKVNMTVYLTAWLPQPADDPDGSAWSRELGGVTSALQKHGTTNVAGVSVGNEFLLNKGSVTYLTQKISEVRDALKKLNLDRAIPVGTGDAGSMITTPLATACDFVMANTHPWFGGLPVDQAAGWTYHYQSQQEPASALLAPNKPDLFIAETGWPSGANDTASLTYQAAVAGIPQMQTFLDTWVCPANANITADPKSISRYFYFELLDEPWKAKYGGVEAFWGLLDSKTKKLKDGLKLPDCASP